MATGVGSRGTALEYLARTLAALREAGVEEPALERVLAARLASVEGLRARLDALKRDLAAASSPA